MSNDEYYSYRRNSKGWEYDPPARIYTNIMFGSGQQLTKQFVEKHNITHVINCAHDQDSPEWFRNAFPLKYWSLGAQDSLTVNITEWFYEFEMVMNEFIRDPTSKMIFVHCQCGINRSGFLALLYGCKKFGYTFDEMVKTILVQRPCALTNSAFKEQCINYIKKLRQ